ncbi:MAG: hypothetical protein ACRETF_10485 [Nevskiaceae bacterium]
MSTSARILAVLTLVLAGVATAHDDWWSRTDDVGRNPVKGTTNEQYDFSATGRIDVHEIGGSVEVMTGKDSLVGFTYERRAATQRDYDCEKLRFEHSKDELRIWTEHTRGRDCQVIRADDKLIVTVPRGASVTVREIGDKVTVTGVAGLVRLADIGDDVVINDAQQVDARDIGDTVKLHVAKLGPAGIRVSDIGDTVELNLPENVDARLRIESVGDEVRAPGLRLTNEDDDYDGVLGKGGPLISIESVGDTVVIRGPRLPQPERRGRNSRDNWVDAR